MDQVPPDIASFPADAHFGKFIRVAKLGVGGYGEVWKAWDTELSRWMALKFLKHESGEELARFLREAQTAASLSHPNIAGVYEIGEAHGHHYIAMQFVDGRTLTGLPRGDRRRIVTLLRDAAAAVEAAHAHGIVHRDLKPDNLMVDAAGRVYVMDFGLARPVEKASGMTASGMAVGTPSYMSPEQARGEVATKSSDVYGLGATMYELLTGRPPFTGADLVTILMAVVEQEPVAPRQLNPAIERELETIVLKCLEKDPQRRYASVRWLREELDRWLSGEPIEAQPLSTIARFARGVRKQKGVARLAGAIVVVLAIAGVLHVVQRGVSGRELARESAERRRREAALQRLATISQKIVDRKGELRRGAVPPDRGRADLTAAVRDAEAHAAAWPDEPQGHYVRARGLMYLGEFDEAERAVRRAIATRDDFRPGWALLGSVCIELALLSGYGEETTMDERHSEVGRRLSDATEAFRRGWEPGRERQEAERWGLPWTREDLVMETLGRAQQLYAETHNAERAAAVLRAVLNDYRAEELARFLSTALPTEERMGPLDLALEWAPGFDFAWLDRGNLKRAMGDLRGALDDYTHALECHADFKLALMNRGSVQCALKQPSSALEDLDRLIGLSPDWYLPYLQRGNAKRQLRDEPGALADYTVAVQLGRGRARGRIARAHLRAALNDIPGALEDFEQAIAEGSKDPDAFVGLSWCRRKAGEMESALVDARRAVTLAPEHADASLELGHVLAALLRREEAIRAYDRVLVLRSDDADAFARRGALRVYLGDSGGLKDLDRALEIDPRHADARYQRGVKRVERGDFAGGIGDLDVAIERTPGFHQAYNSRGYAKQQQGRLADAIGDYDRCIALKQDYEPAFYNRGNARKEKGDYPAAIADFNRALELAPAHAEVHVQRGLAKKAQGDLAAAIEDYTRAIGKNDRLFEAYLNRANARAATRDEEGALADYARAVELRPASADVLYSRSILYGTRKEWERAVEDLEKALKIAPADWPQRRQAGSMLDYARRQGR